MDAALRTSLFMSVGRRRVRLEATPTQHRVWFGAPEFALAPIAQRGEGETEFLALRRLLDVVRGEYPTARSV